ncbi:MAG: helicase [Gemmatimonadetes bacterium]|nr:helicase [Gemmatimonadota bacterium]
MTGPNPVPHAPEFVDNRAGNTLSAALAARILHLAGELKSPPPIDIATGYFNPEGFGLVAAALERAGPIRLLLGAEPLSPPAMPERHIGDPVGGRFQQQLLDQALERTTRALLRDRDRLPFAPATDRAIRSLLAFLKSGQLTVRRYTKRFLHGKAYIVRGHGVIAGSSNFTAAGLSHNLELNLGAYQPTARDNVERWYDELWTEAEPFDLAALYEARYRDYDPYLIYLKVLLERYGDELALERAAGGVIPLTRFQNDGIDRAARIMNRYGGVLIADSVGLGKTFVAGEIIRRVVQEERRRAVLIAPATLRDGTWARFISRFSLYLEVLSYQELADDKQLGGTRDYLDQRKDDYSLVVLDEAHALRNPDTKYAHALRQLLAGQPPKKVMLLTATPVNNSLMDLYYQLEYFIRQDTAFADIGIPRLRARFDAAVRENPFDLKPAVLFDILDATTVRRTRHFVQKWYPNDTVKLPDGRTATITFPRPNVASQTYDLNDVLPGFFDEVARVLQPEDGDPPLTLARYKPSIFRRDRNVEKREVALVGLIRSGLLKRFESSAHAFALTLERMARSHDLFLQGIDGGVILSSALLAELAEADDDEAWDELLSAGEPLDARTIDVARLRAAVKSDRDLLDALSVRARSVSRATDPKLALLVGELASIAKNARERGSTDADIVNRRKVIIFSYFADTVHWISEHLEAVLAKDRRLVDYRGRLVSVTGDDDAKRSAVYGFAPESSEAPAGWTEDKFDILLTTDVLAEGMNLQQAANIINYDLPWNPMRLVQRHGRIDRIGSPHSDVYITCILPDAQLDDMLELEDRIRRKLAQAAASVGLDSEILPGVEHAARDFADDVAEIRRLKAGDATLFELAGEDPSAHSGEEYRQELRKALQQRGAELASLPWGAGSGLVRGPERGHVFCARIDTKVQLRFVPAAAASAIERDALACLRKITCDAGTPRVLPDDLRIGAYVAWERARGDIYDEWTKATDPKNVQPDIRPLFKQAAEHVRRFRPESMTLEVQQRLVESLEAPRSLRDERALRAVFRPAQPGESETTAAIAEFVKERGLEPYSPPETLKPIEPGDVLLVVWMAVEATGNTSLSGAAV